MNDLPKIKERYQIRTIPPQAPGLSESTTIKLSPEDLPDLAVDVLNLVAELEYMRATVRQFGGSDAG